MRKARLIVTRECERHCPHCPNRDPAHKAKLVTLKTHDWSQYDEIILTGGEPLLRGDELFCAMNDGVFGNVPIILYTSIYTEWLPALVPFLSGVTFTLHSLSVDDCKGLVLACACAARSYRRASWRFSIESQYLSDPFVQRMDLVLRALADRHTVAVKYFDWIVKCPLPEGEELLTLEKRND